MLIISATAVRREVYEKFAADTEYDRLRHVNTFGGHPGGCAVAIKNLEIMEAEDLPRRSAEMGERLRETLAKLDDHSNVGDVRDRGLLFGIELVEDKESKEPASPHKIGAVVSGCQERGLIVGKNGDTVAGFNNIVTLAPPLNIADNDMEFIAEKLAESVKAIG